MKSFGREQLDSMDERIRGGKAHEVARELAKIRPNRVPRECRQRLAHFCRRVGRYSLGLKLLRPIVYPNRARVVGQATGVELSEYAALLARAGITAEAVEILKRVDVREAPESLLHRAYTHFERWSFAPAVPLLRQYLQLPVPEYSRHVGSVNLAYALVGCRRHDEAIVLLREALESCRKHGFAVLEANCHELMTRLFAQAGEVSAACAALDEARRIMGSSRTTENRLIRKWSVILESLRTGDLTPLVEYRKELFRGVDSEYRREVDRFSLGVRFDRERFDFLVFGTRFGEYREAVYEETGRRPERSKLILGAMNSPVLDIVTGEIDGHPGLEAGGKCHQLLEVLMRDFYRPLKLGELHSGLFPDERFNVYSSPNRVRQLIHRTRGWIRTHHLPIEIAEEDGDYQLRINGSLAISVPLERPRIEGYSQLYERLRASFGALSEFQPRDARAKLNLPRATFSRFTTWALGQGLLERTGAFNQTRYRFTFRQAA